MRIIALILIMTMMMHKFYLYSMEPFTQKDIKYTFEKTKITLKRALFDVSNLDGTVGFMCIGSYIQQLGQRSAHNEFCAGDIHIFHRKSVMIEVIEPSLCKNECTGEYSYYVEKRCVKNEQHISGRKWYGDEALEKAKNDLGLCYKNVLAVGLQQEFHKIKKIALPILGIAINFPREEAIAVTVSSILEFIKNNPKAYLKIKLFAQNKLEYDECRKFFNYYMGKNNL